MVGRYFSHWKFERLVRHRMLYLPPLRAFMKKDKNEGFIHPEYFQQLQSAITTVPHGGLDQGERNTLYTAENAIRHIKDSTFVSCWTTRCTPSSTSWENYLREEDGVFVLAQAVVLIKDLRTAAQAQGLAFQSKVVTYKDLKEAPASHLVEDSDRTSEPYGRLMIAPEILSAMETGDFLFHKAKSFACENEYRMIASRDHGIDFRWWRTAAPNIGAEYATMGALNHVRIDSREEYEQMKDSLPPEGVLLAVNLEKIVCKIIVRPGVPRAYLQTLQQLMIDCGLATLLTRVESLER